MLLRRCLLACFVLLCGVLPASLPAQTNFTTVVVFGDSLSDTGNIANLTQSQYKVRYPSDNQLLGFDYTDGRFTDGTDTQPAASTAYSGVWVEQMVKLFGANVAVKDSLDGGTNYAYGDATTGSGTTTESKTFLGAPVSITLNNMGLQVTTYLATSPTPNAGTLYVLWGGANDLLNAALAGQDPVAAAGVAVTNELALVQQLRAAGATNFMLPNLPPLGAFAASYGPTAVTALNTASGVFAQGLTAGLTALKQSAMGATLNVYQPDIFTIFQTVGTSPMAVGLGDIMTAADTVTVSPDTFLIWDGLHPTTTGHHFVAATAANLLSPLTSSSTALTAPAAVIAGGSVAVSAVVTSGKSGTIPTGLVTIFSGTAVAGSAALDATGTGKVTFTPTAAAGTTLALTAVYAGDVVNNPSASSVQPTVELAAAVGTTTTVTSSSANANVGASVTFTATVSPTSSSYGAPAGTVTFLDGTTTLGTGTLSAGVATYTTTSLGAGAHQITASYPANGLFAGSTSAALTETITAPAFTAQLSPTSLTLTSGSPGTVTLTVGSQGGYTGTINLSCGTLPAHLACAFSASSLTLSGASPANQTATLTLATNASAALALPARPGARRDPETWLAGFLLPGTGGLMLFGLRRRRATWLRSMAGLLILAGLGLGASGCGGSSNNAPAGTYNVPVVFTPAASSSGSAVGSPLTVNLPVTVK